MSFKKFLITEAISKANLGSAVKLIKSYIERKSKRKLYQEYGSLEQFTGSNGNNHTLSRMHFPAYEVFTSF